MGESSQINSVFHGMHMNNYCLKIIVSVALKSFQVVFCLVFVAWDFFLILLQEVLHPELKECMRFDRLLDKIF